ncbi:hypothetical protein DFS34DRAFT_675609 [Phlyctochytrium arcticum]|nr:hypothetical protein DFS34DRAFT_675609 [Phlyctochytrium arcticum]
MAGMFGSDTPAENFPLLFSILLVVLGVTKLLRDGHETLSGHWAQLKTNGKWLILLLLLVIFALLGALAVVGIVLAKKHFDTTGTVYAMRPSTAVCFLPVPKIEVQSKSGFFANRTIVPSVNIILYEETGTNTIKQDPRLVGQGYAFGYDTNLNTTQLFQSRMQQIHVIVEMDALDKTTYVRLFLRHPENTTDSSNEVPARIVILEPLDGNDYADVNRERVVELHVEMQIKNSVMGYESTAYLAYRESVNRSTPQSQRFKVSYFMSLQNAGEENGECAVEMLTEKPVYSWLNFVTTTLVLVTACLNAVNTLMGLCKDSLVDKDLDAGGEEQKQDGNNQTKNPPEPKLATATVDNSKSLAVPNQNTLDKILRFVLPTIPRANNYIELAVHEEMPMPKRPADSGSGSGSTVSRNHPSGAGTSLTTVQDLPENVYQRDEKLGK